MALYALLFGLFWGFLGSYLFLLEPIRKKTFARAYADGLKDGPKIFSLFIKSEELKEKGISFEEFKKEMKAHIKELS